MIKRPADRSGDSADLAPAKACKVDSQGSSGADTPAPVSCAPAQVSTAPTCVSSAPGQPTREPDQDASAPTQLAGLQNQIARALARDASEPQVSHAPDQASKAPVQPGSPPDKASHTSAQVSSTPTRVTGAPTPASTAPSKAASAPDRDPAQLDSLRNQVARALAQAACMSAQVASGSAAAELSVGENLVAAKGSSKPYQKLVPPRMERYFHPLPVLLTHRGRPRVKPRAYGRLPPREDVGDRSERKAGNEVSVVVVESSSGRVVPPKTPSALVAESGSSRSPPVLVVESGSSSVGSPKTSLFAEPYIIDEDSLDAAAEETVTTSRQERTPGSKSGPQMCPVCKKIISNASNLRQHYNICHSSNERPYPCEVCEKRFNTESNLRQHRRTHTGERPFPCPHCDRCFGTSTNLRQHERTHTGERPFACTECPRAFQTSSNLRQHLRIHSGERPYPCPECGKCFSSTPNLKQHRKTHENRRLEETRIALLQQQNRIAALTKMVGSGEAQQNNREPGELVGDDSDRPDAVIYVEVEERQGRDVSPNGTELIVGYQSVADGSA